MEEHAIRDLPHFLALWQEIYANPDRPGWDHVLPYYDEEIRFKDSVQEIRGKTRLSAMLRRLAGRSRRLEFIVHNSLMQGSLILIDWEIRVSYQRLPKSSIFGASRIVLREGRIIEQRDYYDLWGDILDAIPVARRVYRLIMRALFG